MQIISNIMFILIMNISFFLQFERWRIPNHFQSLVSGDTRESSQAEISGCRGGNSQSRRGGRGRVHFPHLGSRRQLSVLSLVKVRQRTSLWRHLTPSHISRQEDGYKTIMPAGKIGINGFGRIGRLVLRAAVEKGATVRT